MRQLFILALTFITILAPFSSVSAHQKSIIYNDTLTIEGEVRPAHTVVVGPQDNILYIASNTAEDVTPRVFRGIVSESTRIDLTDYINDQYRTIVPFGHSKIGVLYDQYKPIKLTNPDEVVERTSIENMLR